MTAPTLRWCACLLLVGAMGGCASTGNGAVKSLTPQRAAQAIVPGKSTRAEIAQAYGVASITTFPNGYEIWLYQVGYSKLVDALPYVNLVLSSADNPKELSILFDQAGVVKKYQLLDRQP